jgi:hypothetical protein
MVGENNRAYTFLQVFSEKEGEIHVVTDNWRSDQYAGNFETVRALHSGGDATKRTIPT